MSETTSTTSFDDNGNISSVSSVTIDSNTGATSGYTVGYDNGKETSVSVFKSGSDGGNASFDIGSQGQLSKSNHNWLDSDESGRQASENAYGIDDGGLLNESGINYEPTDGFSASLQMIDGQLYLAFRGTEVDQGASALIDDVKANGAQGMRLSTSQYNQAIALARDVFDMTGGKVIFVGHSLGGGLATAAAESVGGRAIVFNAAGVSSRYNHGTASIRAHIMRGDPLSSIQNGYSPLGLAMPDTVGTRVYHEPYRQGLGAGELHSISTFGRQ